MFNVYLNDQRIKIIVGQMYGVHLTDNLVNNTEFDQSNKTLRFQLYLTNNISDDGF